MIQIKIIIPVIICMLLSCKSPSDKVVEDFKKVNESLEQTNKAYDTMNQKAKFTGLNLAMADSLRNLFDKSYSFMDHLKFQLDSIDPGGDKLDAAGNLIIKTPAGDTLYYYTMGIGNALITYGDSSLRKFYTSFKVYDKGTWLKRYFRQVPTVAALTILSKFQNDIKIMSRSLASTFGKELSK